MTREPRPEDVFDLALEQPGVAGSPSELVETAMLLRAIGGEIRAPDGLRARRGALLAVGGRRGASLLIGSRWSPARAALIAAVLTMLTVVGVAAATLADRWLEGPGADDRRPVPVLVPSPGDPDDGGQYESSPPVRASNAPMTPADTDEDDASTDDASTDDEEDDAAGDAGSGSDDEDAAADASFTDEEVGDIGSESEEGDAAGDIGSESGENEPSDGESDGGGG